MRRDRGLTLIELVVAMALFALIAIMGLQAMTGTLRLRDRLTEMDDAAHQVGQALALLRHDMGAAVPIVFHPPEGAPQSALHSGGGALSISVAGQPQMPFERGTGLNRVEWRLDASGTLTRRVWPTLAPLRDSQQTQESRVLTGVTDMEVRSYWPQRGWRRGTSSGTLREAQVSGSTDGDTGLSAVIENYSDTLPLGLEITLVTRDHGRLVLVESLR